MPASALNAHEHPPRSGGKPRQLVVLLHGVGADGADLIGLAPFLAEALPDAAFIAPDAPFHYDMAGFGYQWFSLLDRSPHAIANGVRIAAPLLDAFLDAELRSRGLGDDALALVGFSQGTMMALHVGLRRPRPCAGILGYSGALVAPDALDAEIASYPPVMLIHGEADDVVPVGYLPMACTTLEEAGLVVQGVVVPELGHGIDHQGIAQGARFLAKMLRPTL